MKIAILSSIHWRTPPRRYGPWELIASYIAEGMVKKGHEVTLYATGDSVTKAKLKWICPRPTSEDESLEPKVYQYLHSALPFEEAKKYDIIHNHYDAYPLVFSGLVKTPVVTTIHGFSSPQVSEVYKKYNNTSYVSISMADRKNCPGLNYVANVYHGIPIRKYHYRETSEDYFFYVGRICADKGVDLAVKLAKKMGFRLLIAGLMQDQQYFDREIKPFLNDKIEHLGMITEEEKINLLGGAKAFLHLNTYPEGFGLTLIEAMACGTPVIGMNLGSIPEVVQNGKTGIVLSGISEVESAINNIGKIKREDCRKRVEKYFSIERMVNDYEKVYNDILSKKDKS